jgi:uncharacterized repeat protein (TIGR01451 family)
VTGSGTAANDSATLAGGYFPSGTITFTLHDPSTAVAYTDVVPVGGNGPYTTASGTNPGGFRPTTTGTYQWVATYSGDGNNNSRSTVVGDEPVTVRAPDADLSTTKSGPASAQPGSNVTYTVTVSNAGPDATSATMTDPLPPGTTVVSATAPAGWSCAASTATNVSCSTTTPFAPGPPASFTIVAHVSPAATGSLSNQATVASPADHNSANNTSPAVVTALGCDHTQGSAGGTLTVGSGLTCITGATITGNLVVPAGASVVLVNSSVRGSLSATRPGSVAVCNTTIGGNVRISRATGFVLLGDPGDDACGPDTVHGSVNLSSNHGGVEVGHDQIGGNTSVKGTTGTGPFPDDGGTEIEGNSIGGSLRCAGNVPPPINDTQPNSVTGPRGGQCGSAGF